MLLLHSLPKVKDTPENREFRKYFYSKWGKENCIISARERHADYPDFTQRLSVKAAWGGAEHYHLDGRTVAVDDDNYLLINDQRTYASSLRSSRPVHSFSIFFRPGLAEETLGAMLAPAGRMLEDGVEPAARSIEFAEMLRPHDARVSPILRYIAREADRGLTDDLWYEEQFSFLLERMLRVHRTDVEAINSLKSSRQATRREIFRRIGWSTDCINTFYMRTLGMGDLAASACLSRFHFIRLFQAIHGVTPFVFLQRKRAEVARRLLLSTKLDQARIAAQVGFESRSTMFRQLRRLTGVDARTLRRGQTPAAGDEALH
ncbi:MAG: helix-turn-helix domain-containing protein [Steroidobacteraceae bacterium]